MIKKVYFVQYGPYENKLINTKSFDLLREARLFTLTLEGHWKLTSQEFDDWTLGTDDIITTLDDSSRVQP